MKRLLWRLTLFVVPGVILAISAGVQNRTIDQRALDNAGKERLEDWLTHGLNYQEQRYSLLRQIDATNVNRLALAWTFEIGTGGGNQEATPLVHNGILYSITNWSIAFAVDARTGRELWRYDPRVDQAATQPKICCGNNSRGLALYQDKIYVPVIDGRLIALNAATGKELWTVQTTALDEAYTVTMAPRVVKGNVIIGNSGADAPVRGYVSAYDAATGQLKWRFYTVPGDPQKGFENRAMEVASRTWSGEWYRYGGGGNVWDGISFDPESNLVYFGTGNGGPWPSALRQSSGIDNLYVASIIALNADTGEYRWHYQATPEDSWDYDSVQQLTLADIRIGTEVRKVLMQANKNGFFYVLDRITGKVISAEPFAQVNWASKIDLQTGRPMVNPGARYGREQIVTIMPSGASGAHNWSPMAFNPVTNLMYVPTAANTSQPFRVQEDFTYLPNRLNDNGSAGNRPDRSGDPPPSAAPLPIVGPRQTGQWLVAIDPSTQLEKWRVQAGTGSGGGILTTAANVVFQSTNNGHLVAYRADTGEKLLDIATGQTVGIGPPITFMADGKQYVAVAGGRGTIPGEGRLPAIIGPAPTLYAYALGDSPAQPSSAPESPGIFMVTVEPNTGKIGANVIRVLQDSTSRDKLPTFSPDGRWIAILRASDASPGRFDVVVRSLETGKDRIFAAVASAGRPVWLGNGSALLVTAQTGLVRVDLGNGALEDIGSKIRAANPPDYQRGGVTASPDGKTLYFRARLTGSNQVDRIVAIDLATWKQREVFVLPAGNTISSNIAVSPDGLMLAIGTLDQAVGDVHLSRVAADGSGYRVVLKGVLFDHPTWSPDGRSILISQRAGGHAQIMRVPASGGEPEFIGLQIEDYFALSPDGSRIAFDGADYRISPSGNSK